MQRIQKPMLAAVFLFFTWIQTAVSQPLPVAIAGLVHDHAHGFFRQNNLKELITITGIYETNADLIRLYQERYDLPKNLFYDDLNQLIQDTKPKAVLAYSSTFDHKDIVSICAAQNVHVMMEKPLAVNMEHARAIQQAANENAIHVLVNYETTWYPSNHHVYSILHEQDSLGTIRKMVVHDGHSGPKEIGCSAFFLDWLTDPVLNGGGALTDFGCYGANLMTWLMKGERPKAVTAITQTNKPDVYPKVDDEATILVQYQTAQGIIQASWNWPFNRKDMEVYGAQGYAMADNATTWRVRFPNQNEESGESEPLEVPYQNNLSYLTAVLNGEIDPTGSLSSLDNNMIVTEILDAARESATTGKTIYLH